MNCPKCKTQILSKRSYNSPFSCQQCGGTWVQAKEFSNATNLIAEIDKSSEKQNEHDKRTGVCPEGHGILLRARIDLDEPFYLERCSDCGGIWFDQGEWRQVVDNQLVLGLPDLWSRSWQRKQRAQANRENFLSINRELLGEQVFESIIQLAEVLKSHPEKGRAIALLTQEANEK